MGIWGIIVIVLIILLPILYLLYLKFFTPPSPTTSPTTLKNKNGYVVKEIVPENIKGKVKISQSSKIWSATADEKIETGTEVKINRVHGVHLIVEDIEKEKEKMEPQKDTQEIEEKEEKVDEQREEDFRKEDLEEEIFELVD